MGTRRRNRNHAVLHAVGEQAIASARADLSGDEGTGLLAGGLGPSYKHPAVARQAARVVGLGCTATDGRHAGRVSLHVRPADPRDLDVLVQLRLENGRVHAVLDPSLYRVPDSQAVRAHFDARLIADDDDQVLLVAVIDDRVLGLAEVTLDPPPPAHQILLPVPNAHLHVIVAALARGQGIGGRLELAAREWAGSRGVQQLIAGIQIDNQAAIDFYDRRGYRANATIRLRD